MVGESILFFTGKKLREECHCPRVNLQWLVYSRVSIILINCGRGCSDNRFFGKSNISGKNVLSICWGVGGGLVETGTRGVETDGSVSVIIPKSCRTLDAMRAVARSDTPKRSLRCSAPLHQV